MAATNVIKRNVSFHCTVNLAPAQSHIWHMLCKICFTIILCWLHLRCIWHTMCQKNGEAYLIHVKQNMLHMWLIVLHLRQLCHIVCHIWFCAGTDLQWCLVHFLCNCHIAFLRLAWHFYCILIPKTTDIYNLANFHVLRTGFLPKMGIFNAAICILRAWYKIPDVSLF
jgi:hypothetical protein